MLRVSSQRSSAFRSSLRINVLREHLIPLCKRIHLFGSVVKQISSPFSRFGNSSEQRTNAALCRPRKMSSRSIGAGAVQARSPRSSRQAPCKLAPPQYQAGAAHARPSSIRQAPRKLASAKSEQAPSKLAPSSIRQAPCKPTKSEQNKRAGQFLPGSFGYGI